MCDNCFRQQLKGVIDSHDVRAAALLADAEAANKAYVSVHHGIHAIHNDTVAAK